MLRQSYGWPSSTLHDLPTRSIIVDGGERRASRAVDQHGQRRKLGDVTEATLRGPGVSGDVRLRVAGRVSEGGEIELGFLNRPHSVMFVSQLDGDETLNPSGGLFWPESGKLANRGRYESGIAEELLVQHLTATRATSPCPSDPFAAPED